MRSPPHLLRQLPIKVLHSPAPPVPATSNPVPFSAFSHFETKNPIHSPHPQGHFSAINRFLQSLSRRSTRQRHPRPHTIPRSSTSRPCSPTSRQPPASFELSLHMPLLIRRSRPRLHCSLSACSRSFIHPSQSFPRFPRPPRGVGAFLSLILFHLDLSVVAHPRLVHPPESASSKRTASHDVELLPDSENANHWQKFYRRQSMKPCPCRFRRPIIMTQPWPPSSAVSRSLSAPHRLPMAPALASPMVAALWSPTVLTLYTTQPPVIYIFFDNLRAVSRPSPLQPLLARTPTRPWLSHERLRAIIHRAPGSHHACSQSPLHRRLHRFNFLPFLPYRCGLSPPISVNAASPRPARKSLSSPSGATPLERQFATSPASPR